MKSGRINLTKKQIVDFCKRNHINKFAFFGSVLRDDFRPDSDVDILVEFDRNQHPIGLFEVVRMEIELSNMIGRKVDLRTPQDLSIYFRDKVVNRAKVLYERD